MKLLNKLMIYFVLAALTNWVPANPVLAADSAGMGSITILSPANDAVLQSGMENKLKFSVHLSPRGDHLHIYIDDQSPIINRDLSRCPCSIVLPRLSPGKHAIVVKEATSGHVLTGVQGSVTATVK